MIRFFAQWWAKRQYIWREEITARLNDLNADVSAQRAEDRRELITQLNKEAEVIEKHIEEMAAKEEKGFWRCENGHESDGPSPVPSTETRQCQVCKNQSRKVVHMKFVKRSLMSGQEKYESDQERKDAEKIAQNKREYAAQRLPEEIKGQEETEKHFRRQAASSRELADRLRRI